MRGLSFLVGLCLVVVAALVPSASARSDDPGRSGFFALSGAEARAFVVPSDMQLVRELRLGDVTYERYQQVFRGANVIGAQISVFRSAAGEATTVTGAHYVDFAPSNAVRTTRAEARQAAARDLAAGDKRAVTLSINPRTGRYLYVVETRGFDVRWVHWIDAGTGDIVRKYNALTDNHATGVKRDTKSVSGITTFHGSSGHGARGSHYDLISGDNRQITYDAKNRQSQLYFVTDADNHWTTVTADRKSPGQPALTDAQYYANVTDDYFQASHGFNWTSCYSQQRSVAHYSRNYNNAFWNGTYTVYGDGDGSIFRELSGGLDVVSHEHTHGITDCTSDLVYQDESGALNEAFSDMLGDSAEYYAQANARDPAVTPDWFIGEDVYVPLDAVVGFRNMADPREDDDPDHYSERQIGGDDNGGVHSNSGIPNHAYYLLVNGGQNAGCDAVGSNGHTHSADCGVIVVGIGLAAAEDIFFQSFTSLPANATMCQARKATEAAAAALFGAGSQQQQSTTAAWDAVGVPTSC
jgi:bacillolysin